MRIEQAVKPIQSLTIVAILQGTFLILLVFNSIYRMIIKLNLDVICIDYRILLEYEPCYNEADECKYC